MNPPPFLLSDPITAKGLDNIIPSNILSKAKGLAIFTVIKAGFMFSGRVGSGVVVARLEDGSWSAPSAIGTGGMGFGGQIGAEITDFVMVLNSREAVKSFTTGGNITLGGNLSGKETAQKSVFFFFLSVNADPFVFWIRLDLPKKKKVAAGPIGRTAEAGASATIGSVAAIYSYSKTKGLFAGVSIEGSVIVERKDTNEAFYRQNVTAAQLLSGAIPRPPEAEVLYRALDLKASRAGYGSGSPNGSTQGNDFYHSPSVGSGSPHLNRSASAANPGRFGSPQQQSQYQALESNGYNGNNDYGSPNVGRARASTNSGNYGGTFNSNNNNNNNNGQYGSDSKSRLHNESAASVGASHDDPAPLYTPTAVSDPFRDSHASAPPQPPRMAAKPELLTAIYDFLGEQATDLSFRKGDRITVVKKTDSTNDWWTGRIGTREGSFPRNYCQ